MLTFNSEPAIEGRSLPLLAHCTRLLGEHGITQFCRAAEPDPDSGFCLDDNARALLVAVGYERFQPSSASRKLGETAFAFIADASEQAPQYHHHMDRYGAFVDESASPEAIGRLIWALGVTAVCAPEASWQEAAWSQLENLAHAVGALTTPHARAFAMLGLCALASPTVAAPLPPAARRSDEQAETVRMWARETLYAMAAAMQFELDRNAAPQWMWWEDALTYDNARLPEAMLRASVALHEPRFGEAGMAALRFLGSITQPHRTFVPIGAPNWYARGGTRRIFDQQPLEAAAMVDAYLAALAYTENRSFFDRAAVAYDWYHGRNTQEIVVVESDGGCHDGVTQDGLNPNRGAESTLSYLQASLFLNAASMR